MKGKKKIVSTLLAATMITAGSGSWNASVVKADDEVPTLVIEMLCPSVPQDADKVEEKVSEYTREKINANVDFMWMTYGEYGEKLSLLYSNPDEELDASFDFYGSGISSYVSKGALMDVTDLLQEYGQGIIDTVGEEYLKAGQVDGRQYTLTTGRDHAKQYGAVFRKDIIEDLGIDLSEVKTYEDLTPVFEKIKENYPDINVMSTPGIDGWATHAMIDFDNLDDFFGVLEDPSDLTVTNWYASDEYKKRLDTVRSWNEAGYIYDGLITDSESQCYSMMSAGNLAGYFISQKPGIETQESNAAGVEVVGVSLMDPMTTTTTAGGASWALPINCKYPEKTMEYLNLCYTDEYLMNLLTYGIEGEHYVVKEDGRAGYPDGVDAQNCGYGALTGWIYGNQMLTYVWETDEPTLWDDLKQWNDSAVVSAATGFSFDNSKVKTQYTSLSNIVSKYEMSLEWGFVDPDEVLPQFLKELDGAGINEYIAEKQSQLDAWAQNQ